MKAMKRISVLLLAIGAVMGSATAKDLHNKSVTLYFAEYVPAETPAPYIANAIYIAPINQEAAIRAAYPYNTVLTYYEFNVGVAGGSVIATAEFENDTATLRFRGAGAVDGYGYTTVGPDEDKDTVPWYDLAPYIEKVIVENGITSLGEYLLRDLSPYCKIFLPQSLESFCASSLPANFSSNLTVRANIPPTVTVDLVSAVDFSSANLFVPVGRRETYFGATPWWSQFTNIIEKEQMVVVVPPVDSYNTQVTLVCEVVSNADKYFLKIWDKNDPSIILFAYEVHYDVSEQKWTMSKILITGGPSNKPGLRRDTVRGTTETMQIDITGLSAGKEYGYSIAAMSGSTELSKISGKFSTPSNKPTDIGNTDRFADQTQKTALRYNILGLPVDENYRGVIIEGNRKILQLR